MSRGSTPGPDYGLGRGESSTDRRQLGSLLDTGRFGIDTIDVIVPADHGVFAAFPLQRHRIVLDRSTGALSDPKPTTSELQLDNGVVVNARHVQGAPCVTASFPVPAWLRGDNRFAASAEETRAVVRDFAAHLRLLLGLDDAADTARLRRLDIARDFTDVPEPARLLEELSRKPPGYGMRTELHRDLAHQGAQTVYRRNTRWTSRLYHRGEMYRDTARGSDRERNLSLATSEQGVVRFEVELRARALSYRGLTYPSSLHDDGLWRLAQIHWRRSAFDHRVGADECRLTRMEDELDWKQRGLVREYLLSPARCQAEMAPGTSRKARALAHRFGLTPADLTSAGEVPAGRLDLDAGCFVDASGAAAVRDDYELAS